MKKLLASLIFGAAMLAQAHAAITVHGWLPFLQQSATAGAQVCIDNTGAAVTGQVGVLDVPGNQITTYTAVITLPANSTACYPLAHQFVAGGPVNPFFCDSSGGANCVTTGVWYESCAAGIDSHNCPYASRAYTLIGDIWIYEGQSNDYNFWADAYSGAPAAAANTRMMTADLDANGYPMPGLVWRTPTNAAVFFLNAMAQARGTPQALVIGAIGGAPITMQAANALNTFTPRLGGCYGLTVCVVDAWDNPSTTPGEAFLWPSLKTMIASAGNNFAGIIMGPGESETFMTPDVIRDGLALLYQNIIALNGGTPVPAYVIEIGQFHIWDQYGASQSNTLNGQAEFIAATPTAHMGAHTSDLAMDPGSPAHLTAASQVIKAARLVAAITQGGTTYTTVPTCKGSDGNYYVDCNATPKRIQLQ